MTHVVLTCPRLLFTIGFELTPRPGLRDARGMLVHELEAFGPVREGIGGAWFAVELADAQDAVLAYHLLRTRRHDEVALMSVIGSAAAAELFTAPSLATAWATLRADLLPPLHDASPPDDFSRGIAAARHFTPIIMQPPPDEIAHERLPDAPLAVWRVAAQDVLAIDHDPFELAPLRFERGVEGWRARGDDVMINGQHAGLRELAPGMVIQLDHPTAYVVLRSRR